MLLLRMLGNAGVTTTLPVFQEALEDDERSVRIAAVRALRHISDREADDTLSSVMFDIGQHPQTRAAAVRTAGARRTERVYASVAELAVREDVEGWVKIAALHTLGRAVTRSELAADALRELEAHAFRKQVRDIAGNYLYRLDAEADGM